MIIVPLSLLLGVVIVKSNQISLFYLSILFKWKKPCYQFYYFCRIYRIIRREKYGLTGKVSGRLLKTGINHSYLVNHSLGKFVFRLYSLKWRSDLEISQEIRLLNLLKERGISISCPIIDISANYIQYLEAPEGKVFRFSFL
jgi:Ser/Thr protein kinase RdoA (MazF antagonist)